MVFFVIMFMAWMPLVTSIIGPWGNQGIIVGGVFFYFFMVPAHAYFIRLASHYHDAAL